MMDERCEKGSHDMTTPAQQPKIILKSGLAMQLSNMPISALEGWAQERMSAT